MKSSLINYSAAIMMVLFIIYNLILDSLRIGGLLYQIIMFILIAISIIISIKFRKSMKWKCSIIIVYFLVWLCGKDALQCLFGISSMVTLIVAGFMENHFIKVIAILITIFFVVFSVPLFLIPLLFWGIGFTDGNERSNIYADMYYYCDDNYEVYSYSAGAMDRFHYNIGKHYEFLNIDGIIYISYNERNEVSKEQYDSYLKEHNCSLVGDINGSE